METKKKKQWMNLLMVVLIIVIAGCGVFAVGSVKGWWKQKAEGQTLTATTVTGIANIERSGIGYSLKSDMEITDEDLIETKKGATVEIGGGAGLALNENSELTVTGVSETGITLGVTEGELFSEFTQENGANEITFDEHNLSTDQAVFVTDVRTGSSTISVLSGTVSVTAKDGSTDSVAEGESLNVLTSEDGSITMEKSDLQAGSLSDFAITQAKKCQGKDQLCLAVDDLQKVLDDRAAEKEAALQASLASDTTIPKSDDDSSKSSSKKKSSKSDSSEDEDASDDNDSDDSNDADDEYAYVDDGSDEEEYVYEDEEEDTSDDSGSSLTCTIEIRCDTILNNMDNLSAGKEAYVPSNGIVLSTSTVEFSEGETVFDVLTRVCMYADIQIEYSWTPMYNSYYIEGINHLYEFDCGNESGWMYKVNGWYPNYGCSAYELQDGDVIVWGYTCNGLGADLGA